MKQPVTFYTAGYIRLSREDGDKSESDSITNQKKLVADYLKDRTDFVLYDMYTDDGFTGTDFKRPAFERMIADIEDGRVNCVIVKDLSRFGRDYIDTGKYLERYFPGRKVRFISITDNIDSFRQAYDMLLPIKNIFNEQYARDISRKVHTSMKTKQKAGEFIGAFASYGYRKSPADKNRLVIDEYAAEIVRRIFSMYINGYGKNGIASVLNREGVVCPSEYKRLNGENYRNGHRLESTSYWTYSTINRLLQNEIYTGNMVQGRKIQHMRSRQQTTDRADWIIVENTHDPVIDRETWEKAQDLLQRRTRNPGLQKNMSIFAGFLKCGDCKRAMVKKSDGAGQGGGYCCGTYVRSGRQYCSSHYISGRLLETVILGDLKTIIGSRNDLVRLIEENREAVYIKPQAGQAKKRLDRELDKVRIMKRDVYRDYREKLLTKDEYTGYRQDCIWKEKLLLQQLEDIEARNTKTEQESSVSLWVKDLLEKEDTSELDREIIVEMINNIEIYEEGRIRISYNFSEELQDLFKRKPG